MPETDVCIIGGGAAGMIASIAAGKENKSIKITILEKKDSIGKKLLATGNGRCNLTNRDCENAEEIIEFFHGLGVFTRMEDQGRIYPYSGQASDVLEALRRCLSAQNVQIITSFEAVSISVAKDPRGSNAFRIHGASGHLRANKVLLAMGGKAAPQFGCSGDGYRIAKELGHSIVRVAPALTPIECEGDFAPLKGIRAKAAVSLIKKGRLIAKEDGEVQFTEYGLSGICVMNLSRYLRLDGCAFSDFTLSLDFMPDAGIRDIEHELTLRKSCLTGYAQRDILASIIPGAVSEKILSASGVSEPTSDISKMSHKQISKIAETVKNLTFTIKNAKGWKFAQCTSGGVSLEDIDIETMESHLIKGLFFAGELIDYDGPCGGYNLHNAWQTGIRAGRAIAANV